MPVRQDVQGLRVSAVNTQGYSPTQVAQAQYSPSNFNPNSDFGGGFWDNIAQAGVKVAGAMQQAQDAKAYLKGQQDSAMGKERADAHETLSGAYAMGYNRATVGTDLAKFQMNLGQEAVQFVNQGKTPEEWNQHVTEQTNALLSRAGAQGMNLNSRDWQAWLSGVEGTRNTAADLYQTKNLERAQYLKGQSLAAEGSASIAMVQAASEAGNPAGAMENLTNHVTRIYADNTLSPQQKDGALSAFAVQSMAASKSTGEMETLSAYYQNLEEFKRLPTQVQTQIMQTAQSQYQQRASDEAGQVYSYMSDMKSETTYSALEQKYPMPSVIENLNKQMQARRISPSQYFGLIEEENVRRLKLQAAETKSHALLNAPTMSDMATQTGDTLGKTKTALMQTYAQGNGGYSGGGAALVARGIQSGASDITGVGIEMLQQDAQSLAGIDPRNLKMGADGKPVYPETVVNSLQTLKKTYDSMMRAQNNVQAQQLISGLPDAVAYGIRQNVDANSIADVVYRRANDLAAGGVVALPQQMPREMLGTRDDLQAGLFDTNLTQKGQARNILGVQAWIFKSSADEKALDARLNQFNGALSEEYSSLQQQGKLPQLAGDDLKNWLVGRVAARTVRVDDGTDNGSLLILPPVANKEALFGSVDNKIIAEGLKERIDEFKKANPGATQVGMRYDPMTDELVLSGTDKDNTLLTTSEGIKTSDVRTAVQSYESRLLNNGRGSTGRDLAVPNVGFVKFNTANQYGVDQTAYLRGVNQLVSYEGYTDSKGFSILAKHPTTGAPLNEEKYVKQPTDTPQQAADKFSMYLRDKVLPPVMTRMQKYAGLPESIRERVMNQLIDTTYHAGNADAFGKFIDMALDGDTVGAYKAFRESPLYKDAGADSRRNKDRFATLDAVTQYRVLMQQSNL